MLKASADTGVPVNIQWLPFFLDPTVPAEGRGLREHLTMKYGPEMVARFEAPNNPLDAAGRKVGIAFNKARRVIPTMDCHRVMEWCGINQPDKADKLMTEMFHAYFEEAADLSKHDKILQVVERAGLNPELVRELLASNALRDEVIRKEREYKQGLRISGVPFFIVENNRGGRPTAFSGAQPAEVIAEVLEEAEDK